MPQHDVVLKDLREAGSLLLQTAPRIKHTRSTEEDRVEPTSITVGFGRGCKYSNDPMKEHAMAYVGNVKQIGIDFRIQGPRSVLECISCLGRSITVTMY